MRWIGRGVRAVELGRGCRRRTGSGAGPEGWGLGRWRRSCRPDRESRRDPEEIRKEGDMGGAACPQQPNPRAYGEAGLCQRPQCSVFMVRASGSHRRLVSRRGARSVLGRCGGRTGKQESMEEAGVKVQGRRSWGRGCTEQRRGQEPREMGTGRTSWARGARDGGGAKTAWAFYVTTRWMMDPASGQDTREGQAHHFSLGAGERPVSGGHQEARPSPVSAHSQCVSSWPRWLPSPRFIKSWSTFRKTQVCTIDSTYLHITHT